MAMMCAEIQQQWRFLKSKLIYRLRLAFSGLPHIPAWLTTVVILLLFAAIALPLGFYTHFFKFQITP